MYTYANTSKIAALEESYITMTTSMFNRAWGNSVSIIRLP